MIGKTKTILRSHFKVIFHISIILHIILVTFYLSLSLNINIQSKNQMECYSTFTQ